MSDASKNGRRSNGKFAPGNTLGGGKKQPITKDYARKLLWDELYEITQCICKMSLKDLNQFLIDKDCSLLKYQIITMIRSGNIKALNIIIEQILGRPKQQIETTGSQTGSFNFNFTEKK